MKKMLVAVLLSCGLMLAFGVTLVIAQQAQSPAPTHASSAPHQPMMAAPSSSIELQLRSGAFDPLMGEPPIPPTLSRNLLPAQNGLRLVQFTGPIQSDWYTAMESSGLEVITYLPDYAYLVWGSAAAIKDLQASAPVRWSGVYQPLYALSPQFAQAAPLPEMVDVTVQLFNHPGAALTQQMILAQAQEVGEPVTILSYVNLKINIASNQLDWLAALPDVVNVEPAPHYQKMDEIQGQIMAGNLNAGGTQPSSPGYLYWLTNTIGLTTDASAYPIVDVTDDGIDNGTTTPLHPDFWTFGNIATTDRLIYNYNWSTDATANGLDGHGNINASIVAGYNDKSGFPYEDVSGATANYNFGLGINPFGRVAGSKVFNNGGSWGASVSDSTIISNSYALGARISTNSWGADTGGAYNSESQAYDALVRDAQPGTGVYAGNQPMITVFSAGNAGSDPNTIGSPGTAKNIISVGAAENPRPGWTDGCGIGPTGADNAQDIIFFSSRGPTDDNRVKPDIVAPGTHIEGAASQAAGYNGSGVCDQYMPAGQTLYAASSGTSHSAPAIAGAASLLYRYYQDKFGGQPPSPAMIKAYLMNAARYLTGVSANDTLPSNNQGQGEANLGAAFDNVPRLVIDQSYTFSNTGQVYQIQGVVPDTNQPYRVTVAWTDAPGPTPGNAYVNNLDLAVTINGNTYLGNVFSGRASVVGGSADVRNNVESVFLPAGVGGKFTVIITATNIAGDGVPGNGDPTDQDFALVVYNAVTSVPTALLNVTAISVSDAGGNNNGVVEPGEVITLNIGLNNVGAFTATNVSGVIALTGGTANITTGSAAYLDVEPDATVTNTTPFIFAVNPAQVCGQPLTFVFTSTYSAGSILTYPFVIPTGVPNTTIQAFQNFDGVTAPALPAGWTSTATGGESAWVTQNATSDSAPNNAFSPDPAIVGLNELVTPVFTPTSSITRLTFRNNYNLERGTGVYYDGGVLEIKIGVITYTDILVAGGSFASGGYNGILSTAFSNPLGGRSAWSGNSGGYITTTVNLPASAVGQPVQLRWRVGTDSSTASTGQRIDTITLTDGFVCAAPPYVWTGNTNTNWFEASNWIPTGIPVVTSNVVIPTTPTGSRWPIITGTATSYSLTIQAGAVVTIAQGATLVADSAVNNNGALAQIKNVPAGATTEFLHLTNAALSTDKYHGVDLTPGVTAMGVTTVTVKGNQSACTTIPADPIIHRCYQIDPKTHVSATVRFWFTDAELFGQDAHALKLWHWGPWTQVGGAPNYSYSEIGTACASGGGLACWFQSTGVSAYSPFALGSGLAPNAVQLTQFDGRSPLVLPWLLLGAAIIIGLSVSALILKRRHS